jgi:carboxymethylenebutenolidase
VCDEQTEKENEEYLRRKGLTRRRFGQYGVAAAMTMMLPPVANALDVVDQAVMVDTPDGEADCYFVYPAEGAHAAVILWPDVVGMRPAFQAMGKRLAQSGYSVLVVNPYYRTHQGVIVQPGQTFKDPGVRQTLMPHARSLSPKTCVTDGRAFVAYLDQQPSVDTGRKIGTSGYCMTGSYTMRLAADMPDRIGAGASFHGGQLVTDKENSPHLLVPKIKAGFLIAIAENDNERLPEVKGKLREAFDTAGLGAEIEVYEDTMHGWCPPDSAVYNEEQADRAWNRMLALFERELG